MRTGQVVVRTGHKALRIEQVVLRIVVVDIVFRAGPVVLRMHIQNVPRQKVPRQNVPGTKRPKRQNVPRDKTSQGTKRPKEQNVPKGQLRPIF